MINADVAVEHEFQNGFLDAGSVWDVGCTYCWAHDYHRHFYVLQLDLQHTIHRSTEDRHQRLERVDHVTHANDVTLETQMQFIQMHAYEHKCKCKWKLARERKRARGKRKILHAPSNIVVPMAPSLQLHLECLFLLHEPRDRKRQARRRSLEGILQSVRPTIRYMFFNIDILIRVVRQPPPPAGSFHDVLPAGHTIECMNICSKSRPEAVRYTKANLTKR